MFPLLGPNRLQLFSTLYSLALLDDDSLRSAIRALLMLIPCDDTVDAVLSPAEGDVQPAAASELLDSIAKSPTKKEVHGGGGGGRALDAGQLAELLDPCNPLKLLYCLEVSSSIPSRIAHVLLRKSTVVSNRRT